MAEYRLLADMWMRTDPDTLDDKRPKVARLGRGDLVKGITKDEVGYLTDGARPMLVEADSDADPFKDDASVEHVRTSENAPEKKPAHAATTK